MVGVRWQRWVVHLCHFWVVGEIFHHFQGVLHMALNAQREGLYALQQQEGIEWADGCTLVAQQDGADTCHIGCSTQSVGKHNAVIRSIRFGELWELAARLPVEISAVDNHTAQRSAMSAEEFGGRVHHNVGTMLDGANEIGCSKCVVDN